MEGIPAAVLQKLEEHCTVDHHHCVKLVGQSKNNMKILYRQQFTHAFFYPFLLLQTTALRTMAVAATVIAVLPGVATIFVTAIKYVVAAGSGPALS
jgi:hypothetical protein